MLGEKERQEFDSEYFTGYTAQMVTLVKFRKTMATVFKLLGTVDQPLPNYKDILETCETLLQNLNLFTNTSFLFFRRHIGLELEALVKVLRGHQSLCTFDFLETICNLQECKSTLEDWKTFLQNELQLAPAKGSLLPYSKTPAPLSAFVWILQFYNILVAKAGIYFFSSLKEEEKERAFPSSGMSVGSFRELSSPGNQMSSLPSNVNETSFLKTFSQQMTTKTLDNNNIFTM
jgi:hypothetical protein